MEVPVFDVPYRCPRCGGARTFNSLSDLRTHVAEEHAYSAQKRQRLRIFDYTPNQSFLATGRHSPLLQSFLDEGERLEEEVKAAKKEEHSNKMKRQKQRTSRSPAAGVTPSTGVPGVTEKKGARKVKVNFQTRAALQEPDEYLQESVNQLNQDVLVQRHQQFRTADALYTTQDVLSGVEEAAEERVSEQKNFIAELSRQLVDKEKQLLQLRTELEAVKDRDREKSHSDSLQKQSVRGGGNVENANNISKERQLIEEDLLEKKKELEKLNRELDSARQSDNRKKLQALNERRNDKLSPETNREVSAAERQTDKVRKRGSSDSRSTDISSASANSEVTADSVTQPLVNSSSNAKNRSNIMRQLKQNRLSRSERIPNHNHHQRFPSQKQQRHAPIHTHQPHPPLPDSHQHIHNNIQQDNQWEPPTRDPSTRSQRLKEERTLLVEQMKDLLSKATTDNEKLKDELMAKENQLQFLNQELERTKTNQRDLMEETYDLYREAEKSLGELKERLKQKETQLEQANNRLDEIRNTQERLLSDKENVARNADDKDPLYQNMMRDRDEQIQSLNGLLTSQQEERERLQEIAGQLKRQVQEKEQTQQELRQAITDKEKELAQAREDVETLTKFLQTAAAKESVARCKLEAFVNELIDRADRAEKELEHLRGLENSWSGNVSSQLLSAGAVPTNTGLGEVNGLPVQLPASQATPLHSAQAGSQHRRRGQDSSAQQILQDHLEPWYNNLGTPVTPATPHTSSLGLQHVAGISQPSAGAQNSVGSSLAYPGQITGNTHQPSAGTQNSGGSSNTYPATSGQQAQRPGLPGVGYISLPGQDLQYEEPHQAPIQQFQPHPPNFPHAQNILYPSHQHPSHSGQLYPHGPQLLSQQNHLQLQQSAPNLQPSHSQHRAPHQLPSQTVKSAPSSLSKHRQIGQRSPRYDNKVYNDESPNMDVYSIPQPQSLPLSASSGDFPSQQTFQSQSQNSVPQRQTRNTHPASHVYDTPPYSESLGDDSSKYAALPRKRKPVNKNSLVTTSSRPVSMQSPAYDGSDEQLLSDSVDSVPVMDGAQQQNHAFLVSPSGRVLENGVVAKPANRNNSAPGDRSGRGVRDMVNAMNNAASGRTSQAISPNRSYPIYSISGEDAKEVSNDSAYSHQDTPHFHKAIVERKPRMRGKLRLSGASGNKVPSKLYRYVDDSSTDGVELSVDENGIMWEAVESFSVDSESYRMSPYGSETAGDVDSSVLRSSRSHGNKRAVRDGQDTDEDVDSLDDDGILRPSGERGILNNQRSSPSKKAAGERVDPRLYSVDDEDSESLDLLMKRNTGRDGVKNTNTAVRNATSVYGTRRRAPPAEVEESPIERALAVQRRVKSLTFPRTEKKSVTISDTSSSDLLPRHPNARSNGGGVKPSTKSVERGAGAAVNGVRGVARPVNADGNRAGNVNNVGGGAGATVNHVGGMTGTHMTDSGGVPRPAARPRKVMNAARPQQNAAIEDEQSDNLEDFSSSSYASVPPQASVRGVLGGAGLQKIQGGEPSWKPAGGDRKMSPESDARGLNTEKENRVSGIESRTDLTPQTPEKEVPSLQLQNQQNKESVRGRDSPETAVNQNQFAENKIGASSFNHKERRDQNSESGDPRSSESSEKLLKESAALKTKASGQPQSSVSRQLSANTPLMRQASVSVDETTLKNSHSAADANKSADGAEVNKSVNDSAANKFVDEEKGNKSTSSSAKPARQMRARFAQSCSESSIQSSENESSCVSPPLPLLPPQPSANYNDSTDIDFDLESDLEKFTGPGGAEGGRRGSLAGKSGIRKTQKKIKGKKAPQGGKPNQLKASEDSGSGASDIENLKKNKRREEARRRRVALFRIFSYLDTRNLCKMALVCKEWQRVSRHPSLWKNVHLKYERVSSQFLVTLSHWCTQMSSLTLEGLRCGSRRNSETMDEYHRRTRGCLEHGLEELLKASQDTLTSLSIIACGNVLTDKCMWLVSGYCRLLQKLTYLSDTHPLTAEVMWALGGGCPSITSLIIPPLFPCHNSEGMTNRCLMLISQFYPDLLQVGVGGHSLDITGLVPLVQSCQRLHGLSLDHIKEMGDDSATALCRAGLRQLQELEICGTPVTAQAIKTYYDSCRHLKEIRVFVCINDYFEDVRKKKNKEEYKKIVKNLEELKSQVGLGNILQLRAAPAE